MADDGPRLIATLEARVNKFERDLARANGTARREFGAIEKRSQLMAQRLESTVGSASTRAEARLRRLSAAVDSAATSLRGGLAGLAASLAGQASLGGVRSSIADLAKLNDVAERTGASAKFLQEFAYAVRQSGGEADEAATGLQKFAINVSKAAAGGGDLAKVFEANGVAVADAAGKMRPIEELLGDYAELVKNAGSEQDRLNLAAMAFGKSAGPALVLALAGGKDGLEEMFAAARKTGNVLGDDLVKNAADLDDQFAELEDTVSGLGKTFAVEFAGPVVREGLTWLIDTLREVRGVIESIRNMDLGALGKFLISRTGPGFLVDTLAPQDLDSLTKRRDSLRGEIEAAEKSPPEARTQQLAAGAKPLDQLKRDLKDVEDRIAALNVTPGWAARLGEIKLPEIKVEGRRTVVPGESETGEDKKAGGLKRDFNEALQGFIAAAKAAGHDLSIVSGYRSTARQAQLYADDIRRNGGKPSGYVAPPGRSNHERGLAADLGFAGGGHKAKGGAADAARAWAHANAADFGLKFPMLDPKRKPFEPWHVEDEGARGGRGATGRTDEDRRADAIRRVVEALQLETDQVGKTELQQRILQEVQAAGVDLNSREGQAIAAKVQRLFELKAAQDAAATSAEDLRDKQRAFADIGADATKGLIKDLREGVSAGQAFAGALDRIADRLIDMAVDKMFQNIFAAPAGGAAGGGILGFLVNGISSLFGGARAKGGPLEAGKFHLVGEKGPELVAGRGTVIPSDRSMRMLAAPPPIAAATLGAPIVNMTAPKTDVIVNNNAPVEVEATETQDARGNRRLEVRIDEMIADSLQGPRASRTLERTFGLSRKTIRR